MASDDKETGKPAAKATARKSPAKSATAKSTTAKSTTAGKASPKAGGLTVQVVNLEGESGGEIALDPSVFGQEVRVDLMHRMVVYQLAKRRQGSHKVKTRGEITGSNRKQFKQKGTGNARRGNGKVSQFVGGGRAFGPVVRDHSIGMPKKMRRQALASALSARAAEGKLVVLDKAELKEARSKLLKARLEKLSWGRALVVGGPEWDQNFALAARNLIGIDLLAEPGINVYDILGHDTLVLTSAAVESLTSRLGKQAGGA